MFANKTLFAHSKLEFGVCKLIQICPDTGIPKIDQLTKHDHSLAKHGHYFSFKINNFYSLVDFSVEFECM